MNKTKNGKLLKEKNKKKNQEHNEEENGKAIPKDVNSQENKKYKRFKPQMFLGKATSEDENKEGFLGRNKQEKKIWLYISKVQDHVTEETVKNFILF